MAIERIDENLCTGCGTCVNICPRDVIRIDEKTQKPVVKYPEDCTDCGFCQAYCPENAVITRPGTSKPPYVSWR